MSYRSRGRWLRAQRGVDGVWVSVAIFCGRAASRQYYSTDGRLLYGWVMCGRYNTLESIIMTRRPPTTEIHIVLRIILSAGVLLMLVVSGAYAAPCTDSRCAQAAEVAA